LAECGDRLREDAAADILALVSSENFLPLKIARSFILVASDCWCPGLPECAADILALDAAVCGRPGFPALASDIFAFAAGECGTPRLAAWGSVAML